MTEAAAPERPSVRGRLVVAVAGLVSRLPEPPLVALAEVVGELYYRLAPSRAVQVRANLRRVCEGLAATDRGTPLARRAATDPEALERLVRRTFRHLARYYLEVARVASLDSSTAVSRIDPEDRDALYSALTPGHPAIVVGLHFGAIELPVVLMSYLVGHHVMAPMESVADPALRHWFVTSRHRVGVNAVPLVNARRALLGALRRGESIGIAVDRDIVGNGLPTPFFGHLAPIPAGPALLAVEAGVPVYVGAVRRSKGYRYIAHLALVPTPETGTRREKVNAILAGITAEFERVIAVAPEQWWGSFHPIWPDIAVRADPAATAVADGA